MKHHGKKYRQIVQSIDSAKVYNLEEAVDALLKSSPSKFDATCEVHVNLGINLKDAEQSIRGTVELPHGTGKKVRVIAFVPDDKINEAKSAGAIEAGEETLIDKINKGWLDFDTAVAVPEMMKKLGKIAKTLGQKGLMPNPKSGTVSPNISETILSIMKGKIEFRNDKSGNLHNPIGKVSFGKNNILENCKIYLKSILEAKPSGSKGTFIKTITLATTMGPGIKIDVQKATQEVR